MLSNKKVGDVMTKDVDFVIPQDTLREAAEKMRQLNVGPLPVVDGDRPIGIITDRDIVVRAIALGHDPSTSRVADIMSTGLQTCTPETSLKEAGEIMKQNQIRRLLVVDDSGKLAGILALADLAVEGSDKLAGETLENISEPSAPSM